METAQPDRLEGISVENREPLHEAIAMRAYELSQERGRPEGFPGRGLVSSQDESRTRSGGLAVENAFCTLGSRAIARSRHLAG